MLSLGDTKAWLKMGLQMFLESWDSFTGSKVSVVFTDCVVFLF